jgi:hypothetical protein
LLLLVNSSIGSFYFRIFPLANSHV